MSPTFAPVHRRTVAEEVRLRLVASIRAGQLPPGSTLPSERSLCDDFGVARTSVREAIQGLVSVGVVERRANRAYVAQTLAGLELDGVPGTNGRVRQLCEVRRLVEVAIAELAAQRATPAQRDEVRALSGRFSPDLTAGELVALEREFQATVGRCAANPVLAEVARKVLDALAPSGWATLAVDRHGAAVGRFAKEWAQGHRAVARAVVAGDGAAAAAAAGARLDRVEERMLVSSP